MKPIDLSSPSGKMLRSKGLTGLKLKPFLKIECLRSKLRRFFQNKRMLTSTFEATVLTRKKLNFKTGNRI
jgi:hypothetical protein